MLKINSIRAQVIDFDSKEFRLSSKTTVALDCDFSTEKGEVCPKSLFKSVGCHWSCFWPSPAHYS